MAVAFVTLLCFPDSFLPVGADVENTVGRPYFHRLIMIMMRLHRPAFMRNCTAGIRFQPILASAEAAELRPVRQLVSSGRVED